MELWEMATSIEVKKRAPTVFLTLEGKAREAVLKMDIKTLNENDGMTKLYEKLDTLFKEDSDQSALLAYEAFEKYQKPEGLSVCDYLIEFDCLVAKLKDFKITVPEPILAYRVLKSANLKPEDERLIKATVSELTLAKMSEQLKKVMRGYDTSVKKYPAVQVKNELDIEFNESSSEKQNDQETTDEVYYGRYSGRRPFYNANRRGRGNRGRGRSYRSGTHSSGKKFNPPGPDGKPSKCNVCGCTLHWAKECPYGSAAEKPQSDQTDDYVHEAYIVLMNQYVDEENLTLANEQAKEHDSSTFLGETIGCVVLDSGASGTVCGLNWYECFLETLPDQVRKKIKIKDGKRTYKFGDGNKLQSLCCVTLPCVIDGIRVDIITDVVDSDIPLLLSKAAMKRAKTKLNFENDTVVMLGRKLKLNCTSSGHYYVPLTRPLPTRENCNLVMFVKEIESMCNIVCFVKEIESKSTPEKYEIAKKLHRQFSHPSGKKLCDLVIDAGVRDAEFIKILKELPHSCEICLRYKKAQPRPVVGFSLGSYFNENVAMDIKEIKGIKVLHLIDHGTRFSVGVKIRSKESSEIIRVVFKHWIAYFGTPGFFLTDNGGEFDNEEFREMAQQLNIVVRTTAAESPWSNGLNERHNGILGEMVKKTLEDTGCDFEVALFWAVSAKNTLHSVNGFSPNQLVFGRNPNLPAFLNDNLPALEGISASEVVASNLNAKYAARKAFIESESSEKLRRAVRHQVRTSIVESYNNGDMVLFKRNKCERWLGPGTVIGWENKQVLVKHGGSYVRVHPSRLRLYHSNEEKCLNGNQEQNINNAILPQQISDETLSHSDNELRDVDLEPGENVDSEEQISGEVEAEQNATPRKRGRPSRLKSIPKFVALPKPGQIIKCKLTDDDDSGWRELSVISKAGKATGKNKHMMNVVMEEGEPFWLDFDYGVTEWQTIEPESTSDIEQTSEVEENVMITYSDAEQKKAKKKELDEWKENKVYSQVLDRGQPRISTRWVDKTIERSGDLKTRLVAKGFQDEETDKVRSDSPTCSKEGLRIAGGIIKSQGWTPKSMDIKTAFLQSKNINRLVYLDPPPEANVPSGYIWKLEKCVYGLTDASRSWYLTVKEELFNLGAVSSKYNQAIFTWYFENKLHGIIAVHVDDFCFGGSKIFQTSVIDKLHKIFKVKSEEVAEFKYVGLEVKQNGDSIRLGQDEYVKKLKPIPIANNRNADDHLSPSEVTEIRQLIGQLNWLATQTRPDLGFDVSNLSSVLKQENVECIKQVNKTVKKAKKEKSQIIIPDLGRLDNLSIVGYSDASFANLRDGGSQGGYIIFLVGSNKNYMPIAWQSKRIKRVVKSTLAAETLAMVDLAEACIFYRKLLLDLLHWEDDKENIPITCKTDNSCMYDSVHSTTQILDKRLRIEMAILREMLFKRELSNIAWIPTDIQVADALTKKGVPSFKILGYVSEPKVPSV